MPSSSTFVADPRSIEKHQADAGATVHFITGGESILRLQSMLLEFATYCGQPGVMQDLHYFLAKPGVMPRTPHLLVVSRQPTWSPRDLNNILGIVLIFEHSFWNVSIRAFATNDRSGRNCLIAAPADRPRVARLTAHALLKRGARLILMSFCNSENGMPDPTIEPVNLERPARGKGVARWVTRDRTVPGHLPLFSTFDETLANIGQKTRSNLRYYRRRAEAELGCQFEPRLEISQDEMMSFNRDCMYAVSPEVMSWRYHALKDIANPILMGLKHKDGRWLSMLGGRRYLDRSELLWQLNWDGLKASSLSTVMRSYFIEHEIAQGSRRLYIEGGTPHPIKFSFVPETITDLVVVRRSLLAKTMKSLAKKMVPPDNELSKLLAAAESEWKPC